MNRSDSIVNLSKALLNAQKTMGGATKGSKNPFYKSNYADYGSVLEVVKDPLNEAGIVVLQPTIFRDGKTLVETTLIHAESGEFMSSEIEVIASKQNDPQAYGSALTYARRYSLQALLSIPSEDDDGEKAMARPSKSAPVNVGHAGDPPVLVNKSAANTTGTSTSTSTVTQAKPDATLTVVPPVARPSFRKSLKAAAASTAAPVATTATLVAPVTQSNGNGFKL